MRALGELALLVVGAATAAVAGQALGRRLGAPRSPKQPREPGPDRDIEDAVEVALPCARR